jgi:hypothetical protein
MGSSCGRNFIPSLFHHFRAAAHSGPTGIQNGFVVFGIPEPKGAYLLFAGFAVCLVFQRRVWPAREPRRVATTSVVWMSNNCKTKLSV